MSLTFNTAMVSTRAPAQENCLATELAALTETPACRAIFSAARALAQSQNISELEASEQIIRTFRKMDELWGKYVQQEGMARLSADPN